MQLLFKFHKQPFSKKVMRKTVKTSLFVVLQCTTTVIVRDTFKLTLQRRKIET